MMEVQDTTVNPKAVKTCVLLAAILAATQGHAGIRIDLHELTGDYSLGGEEPWTIPSIRTTFFTLPDSIESIAGLRLVSSGSWFPGVRERCTEFEGGAVCDTLPWGVTLAFRLTSTAFPGGSFYAEEGAFYSAGIDEELVPIAGYGTLEFDQLLGVEVCAEFFCNVPEDEVGEYMEATHGELTEIVLETVGAVSVASMSWAGVKALFR